jgi:SsrA-binding protein
LSKKEIGRIASALKEKGYTLVPLKIFFSEKGLIKIEIGLGRGKKQYDKRESIKKREAEREIKRTGL